MVLEAARFVERNAAGRYRIGSRVMELGLSAASRLDVYEVAPPHLRALAESTSQTAHLALLGDGETVSLIDVEGRN
jgi:DNA-binding IclR family transcriptional regulator